MNDCKYFMEEDSGNMYLIHVLMAFQGPSSRGPSVLWLGSRNLLDTLLRIQCHRHRYNVSILYFLRIFTLPWNKR